MRGSDRVEAARYEGVLQRLEYIVRLQRTGSDVRAENVREPLRRPRVERGRHRDPHAAAYVAHEVEQACGVTHLLVGNGVHGHRGEKNEQQPVRKTLEKLRPEEVPKSGVQVKPGKLNERETGAQEAQRQQLAWIELRHQDADH